MEAMRPRDHDPRAYVCVPRIETEKTQDRVQAQSDQPAEDEQRDEHQCSAELVLFRAAI